MSNESSGEIRKASFGQISLTPPEVIHRRCWGRGREYDRPTLVLAGNQEMPESALTSAKPKSMCGLRGATDPFLRNGMTAKFGCLLAPQPWAPARLNFKALFLFPITT